MSCRSVHYVIAVATLLAFATGCSDPPAQIDESTERLPEQVVNQTRSEDEKVALRDERSQERPRIYLEKLLSPDPELSRPELDRAIELKEAHDILLCWILGADPESRKTALKYFLRLETEVPELYKRIILRISKERGVRLQEIEEVARELEKGQRYVRPTEEVSDPFEPFE